MSNLALLPEADCIAEELGRVQANLTVLTKILGHEPARVEAFIFRIATRDLELTESLEPVYAASELEERVARAKNRTHALLNECSFEAIRALDARLQSQVHAGLAAKSQQVGAFT